MRPNTKVVSGIDRFILVNLYCIVGCPGVASVVAAESSAAEALRHSWVSVYSRAVEDERIGTASGVTFSFDVGWKVL